MIWDLSVFFEILAHERHTSLGNLDHVKSVSKRIKT